MADFLGLVSKSTKTFLEVDSISIDNWCFKCFYKVSVVLMVISSVLVSSKQFFGSPIACDAGNYGSSVKYDVLESYCWMYAHFRIPPEYKGACSGRDQGDDDGPIYNSYYQWVPIYLIFLAVLFYLPRCLWLVMEGGLMKFFGKGTTTRLIEQPDEKRDRLIQFFKENIHNKYHIYFCGFIFCEMLNLVVVIFTLLLTNRFLNYRFLSYGFSVWMYYSMPPEEQTLSGLTNPMCYTFPRITACDYYRFGAGGSQENVNAICILALNIINDKVFLVLWWWFLLLIFLGILRAFFRLAQVTSSRLRFQLLNLRMHRYFKRNANTDKIHSYVCKCSRGDWFVLYQLSKNLNRPFFMDFLITLSRTVDPLGPCKDEERADDGDGVLEIMMKPTLKAYESKEEDEHKAEDQED